MRNEGVTQKRKKMLVMRRIEGETSSERKRGSCSEKKKNTKNGDGERKGADWR